MADPTLINKKAQELLKSMDNKYDEIGNITLFYFDSLEKGAFDDLKAFRDKYKKKRVAPIKPVVEPEIKTDPIAHVDPVENSGINNEKPKSLIEKPMEVIPKKPKSIESYNEPHIVNKPLWIKDETDVEMPGWKRMKYLNPERTKKKYVRYVNIPEELLSYYKSAKSNVSKQMIGRMSEMWTLGGVKVSSKFSIPLADTKANILAAMKYLYKFEDINGVFSGLRKLNSYVKDDLDKENKYIHVPEVFEAAKGSFAKRFIMTPETRKSFVGDITAVVGNEGFKRMEADFVENLIHSMNQKTIKDKSTGQKTNVPIEEPYIIHQRVEKQLPIMLKDILASIEKGPNEGIYDEKYRKSERMRTMGRRIGIELFDKYLADNANITMAGLRKQAASGNAMAEDEISKRIAIAFISKFFHNAYGMTLSLSPSTLSSSLDRKKLKSPIQDLQNIEEGDDMSFLEPEENIPEELYKSNDICILVDVEDMEKSEDNTYFILRRGD